MGKRVKKTHGEPKDYISELPDPILVHILSFLPTEDVVKTVLLRRFGNLWRSVPVIDLNGCLSHRCEDDEYGEWDSEGFVKMIHHVSNLHDVEILDKLRLKFWWYSVKLHAYKWYDDRVDYTEIRATSGIIDKLIGYAINRKVKVLDLNFRSCMDILSIECYVLRVVFRSDYLTDLRLTACDINSWGEISLKALRSVLFRRVSLSDRVMENILLGSPLLENLSLTSCWGLRNLHCESPNLKKLRLILSKSQKMLRVSGPHVRSLKIAGLIGRATLLDVPFLVDASISYSYFYWDDQVRPYDDAERLLQKISWCNTFTPCRYTILMLTTWNFRNVPCLFYQWKNLVIPIFLTKWHQPGLSWLLKSSPSLERLKMYVYPDSYERPESDWELAYDFDEESYWDVQNARFPCLKNITIRGYTTKTYFMKMLKFLLKNATRLQKMVISITTTFKVKETGKRMKHQFTMEQRVKLMQELLTFPRASSQAMVYVS